MGLRFRKSVTLCKGVRLNLGKNGASISAGVPGFRKTIHSSGRVTTSVGIPGTGIYYVDTKNLTKNSKKMKKDEVNVANTLTHNSVVKQEGICIDSDNALKERINNMEIPKPSLPISTEGVQTRLDNVWQEINIDEMSIDNKDAQELSRTKDVEDITYETINKIFGNCDTAVNWIEVISNQTPLLENINLETWTYLHEKAVSVFDGDIDTYLDIISTVNPYDDLLDYAENFEFGTDDSTRMEVEFSVIDANIDTLSKEMFEDYYSAIAIRVARDTFAILPVEEVVVNALYKTQKLLSVTLERSKFHNVNLEGKDASDIIKYMVRN